MFFEKIEKILNSKIKKTVYFFGVLVMLMSNFSVMPAEAFGGNGVQLASVEDTERADMEYRARQEALRRMYERKRKEMEGQQETSQSSPDNIDLSKVKNWRNGDASFDVNQNSNTQTQNQNSSLNSNKNQNKNQPQQQQQDAFTSIRNSNGNNGDMVDVSALNTGGLGNNILGLSKEDLEYAKDKCLSVASNASICNSKEILTQVGVCLKTGYDMDYCEGLINPATAMEAASEESMCSAKFPSWLPLIGGKQAFSNCGEALLEGAGLLLMFTPLAGLGMLAKLGKGARYVGGLLGLTDKAVEVAEAGNALNKLSKAEKVLATGGAESAESTAIAELNASKEVLANELRRKGIIGESETLTAEKLDSLVASGKLDKSNSMFAKITESDPVMFIRRRLDKDYNAEEIKSLAKELSNAEKKLVGNEREKVLTELQTEKDIVLSKQKKLDIEKRGAITNDYIRAKEEKMDLTSKYNKLKKEFVNENTTNEKRKQLLEEVQNIEEKIKNRDYRIDAYPKRINTLEEEIADVEKASKINKIEAEIKELNDKGRASLDVSRTKIEQLAERQAIRSNADYQLGKSLSKKASAVGLGLNAPIPTSGSDAKHYNTKAGDETINRTKEIMYGKSSFQEFDEAQSQNKTARAFNKKIRENKEALNDSVSVSEYLTNSNTNIFKK